MRNTIRHDNKPARDALFAFKVTREIDDLAVLQTVSADIFRIQEDHPPAVANPAITIVETVDRRIELIVAAHRHHQELSRLQVNPLHIVDAETRATVRGLEFTHAN